MMNEQYDMDAFDAMVERSKAHLQDHYRRNVHDGMLHGWIEGVKHERKKADRLRDELQEWLNVIGPEVESWGPRMEHHTYYRNYRDTKTLLLDMKTQLRDAKAQLLDTPRNWETEV